MFWNGPEKTGARRILPMISCSSLPEKLKIMEFAFPGPHLDNTATFAFLPER
jgi:hypothetical protein